MHAFDLSHPTVPDGFEDYLSPVLSLCDSVNAKDGTAYMTVDEKIVLAGTSQRRPKPHVDGCFIVPKMDWSHPGPSWNHSCNSVLGGVPYSRMPVIVAASVPGCKAWRGEFYAEPSESGDLSHVEKDLGVGEILLPGVGYLLSPDCIHESMVFNRVVERSFLRIALPVTFNFRRFL